MNTGEILNAIDMFIKDSEKQLGEFGKTIALMTINWYIIGLSHPPIGTEENKSKRGKTSGRRIKR
jgi:hypothetical protein